MYSSCQVARFAALPCNPFVGAINAVENLLLWLPCDPTGCVQQAASNENVSAMAGIIKQARGLDDYAGLMREFRELQRASHTLSGELARERHLRSPYL